MTTTYTGKFGFMAGQVRGGAHDWTRYDGRHCGMPLVAFQRRFRLRNGAAKCRGR